ncbi:MAG: hydrolase, partial [Spirochaetes bacterium]|nr:hydrolase [Spirochaetota bacterium]
VTFILPEKFRVLFAALLSVFLGLFLAFAKSKK